TFHVSLLPASIAFGAGNNLYVASNTCGGLFTHWTLDLPIFDSALGREISQLPAGKAGFRGYITISANKQILLAHADREKMTFEGLEDTVEVKDEQWQVWDLSAKKLLFTFPKTLKTGVDSLPSLSNSGDFIYAYQEQEMKIFSVLRTEK